MAAQRRLNRDELITTALAVADAEGLDAVTIRRVAQLHDVTPMALYRHFPDKEGLLVALAGRLLAGAVVPEPDDRPWHQQLRDLLSSFLDALRPHPNAAMLVFNGMVTTEPGLAVTERPDLREVHLGEWNEGGFRKHAAERSPEYLEFVTHGRWEVIPGAEADDALRARMVAAVAEVAAEHPGGRVAIVCHGGSINAWLADRFGSHRSMIVSIDNTSITQVRTDGTSWLVQCVNDRSHLGIAP